MDNAFGLTIFIIFAIFWLLFLAICIAAFVFWIIALIDVSKREFEKPDDKTMWLLVILLGGGIGAVVYYFVIMRKPKRNIKSTNR